MGDAADDAFDTWLRNEAGFYRERKPDNYQRGSGNYMWRQANGIVVDMHEMTNDHISNAIKICRKYNNTGKLAQLEEVLRDRLSP